MWPWLQRQRVQCNPGYSCDPEYKGRGFLTLSVFFYTLKQKVRDRGFLTLSVFFYTLKQKKRDRGFLTLSVFFYTLKQKKRDRGFLTLSVFFHTLKQKKETEGSYPIIQLWWQNTLWICQTETNALLIRLYYTVITPFLHPHVMMYSI